MKKSIDYNNLNNNPDALKIFRDNKLGQFKFKRELISVNEMFKDEPVIYTTPQACGLQPKGRLSNIFSR